MSQWPLDKHSRPTLGVLTSYHPNLPQLIKNATMDVYLKSSRMTQGQSHLRSLAILHVLNTCMLPPPTVGIHDATTQMRTKPFTFQSKACWPTFWVVFPNLSPSVHGVLENTNNLISSIVIIIQTCLFKTFSFDWDSNPQPIARPFTHSNTQTCSKQMRLHWNARHCMAPPTNPHQLHLLSNKKYQFHKVLFDVKLCHKVCAAEYCPENLYVSTCCEFQSWLHCWH